MKKTVILYRTRRPLTPEYFHDVREIRLDRNIRTLILKTGVGRDYTFNVDHLLSWTEFAEGALDE